MGKKAGHILIVFVVLFISCKSQAPHPLIKESLEAGNLHFSNGKYDQAITSYDTVILILKDSNNPNMVTAHYNRGLAFLMKRDYERAIEDFTAVIDINPRDARAYYNRGSAYSRTKIHKQAIEDFLAAIEIEPQDINVYYSLGMTYFTNSEYDKSAETLSKAIALKPDFARAYNGRGQAYLRSGDLEKAIPDFQRACQMGEECGCIMMEIISKDNDHAGQTE